MPAQLPHVISPQLSLPQPAEAMRGKTSNSAASGYPAGTLNECETNVTSHQGSAKTALAPRASWRRRTDRINYREGARTLRRWRRSKSTGMPHVISESERGHSSLLRARVRRMTSQNGRALSSS